MQPDKKQLEMLYMHYFRVQNPDFPKGKLQPSESPDFILKLKTKSRIGIELTRLNPLNARVPDVYEQEQKLVRERIIESAKNLLELSSGLKLFVKVVFSDTVPIEEEREILVTARVADSIRRSVQFLKPTDFYYKVINKEYLPRGMESILVIHHPEMKISMWERSNNLGMSEDVLSDIREAIHKKDEKLRLYQQQSLNYYWLVIIADRLRGVKNYNLHDKIMNHVFQSRFQQVYLFDLIKSKTLQLV
jgi:hypothetical protein